MASSSSRTRSDSPAEVRQIAISRTVREARSGVRKDRSTIVASPLQWGGTLTPPAARPPARWWVPTQRVLNPARRAMLDEDVALLFRWRCEDVLEREGGCGPSDRSSRFGGGSLQLKLNCRRPAAKRQGSSLVDPTANGACKTSCRPPDCRRKARDERLLGRDHAERGGPSEKTAACSAPPDRTGPAGAIQSGLADLKASAAHGSCPADLKGPVASISKSARDRTRTRSCRFVPAPPRARTDRRRGPMRTVTRTLPHTLRDLPEAFPSWRRRRVALDSEVSSA